MKFYRLLSNKAGINEGDENLRYTQFQFSEQKERYLLYISGIAISIYFQIHRSYPKIRVNPGKSICDFCVIHFILLVRLLLCYWQVVTGQKSVQFGVNLIAYQRFSRNADYLNISLSGDIWFFHIISPPAGTLDNSWLNHVGLGIN